MDLIIFSTPTMCCSKKNESAMSYKWELTANFTQLSTMFTLAATEARAFNAIWSFGATAQLVVLLRRRIQRRIPLIFHIINGERITAAVSVRAGDINKLRNMVSAGVWLSKLCTVILVRCIVDLRAHNSAAHFVFDEFKFLTSTLAPYSYSG